MRKDVQNQIVRTKVPELMQFQEHLQRLLVGEIQGVVRHPGGLRHGGQMNQDSVQRLLFDEEIFDLFHCGTQSQQICAAFAMEF